MAISGKYGRIDIPNVPDDEPVFIFRAQDKLSLPMIEIYKILAVSHDAPIASQLDAEIKRFKEWTGNKKLPD